MMNPEVVVSVNDWSAWSASHALLSSFIHETSYHTWRAKETVSAHMYERIWPNNDTRHIVSIDLPTVGIRLFAPAYAKASFGAVRFSGAVMAAPIKNAWYEDLETSWPIDTITLGSLLFKTLEHIDMVPMSEADRDRARDAFLTRLLASAETQRTILSVAEKTMPTLKPLESTFLDFEQSLWQGHPLHPLPKSRIGFSKEDVLTFSPETGGHFALHYLLVHPSLVRKDDGGDAQYDISGQLRLLLRNEKPTGLSWAQLDSDYPGFEIVPLHPWQARGLAAHTLMLREILEGRIVDLGQLGPNFYPTSSVRTVVAKEFPYMLKVSLGVEITNSKRLNKERELWRAAEAHQLFHKTEWGRTFAKEFPNFAIITDPGSIALVIDGTFIEETASTLRVNPFAGASGLRALPVAALCEMVAGRAPLVRSYCELYAEKTGLELETAARRWFEAFTTLVLDNLLSIYFRHGLAFEAHQQNVVIRMNELGLPVQAYYRDNQGVFHRDTAHEALTRIVPGLGEKSGSIGPEALVDERLGYYLVQNNVLGLASVMVATGLLSEKDVVRALHAHFEKLAPLAASHHSNMLTYLTRSAYLPGKANFFTRVRNLDELVGDPRFQSVYVMQPNALFTGITTEKPSCKYRDAAHDVTYDVRSFDMDRDFAQYAAWMRLDYVDAWWKLKKTDAELKTHLRRMLGDTHQELLWVTCEGKPMAYAERYFVVGDVLGQHIPHEESDQGFHLLVDRAFLKRGLAESILVVLTRYCFDACPETDRVLGEPDAANGQLLKHAEKTGFRREGTVQLPGKTAALMVQTRKGHFERFTHVSRI